MMKKIVGLGFSTKRPRSSTTKHVAKIEQLTDKQKEAIVSSVESDLYFCEDEFRWAEGEIQEEMRERVVTLRVALDAVKEL